MLKNLNFKLFLPYIIILIVSVIFTFPIFKNFQNTGSNDWDLFYFSDGISRKAILEDRQFPLWNPYVNGGRPQLGHPQVGFLRPAFLFSLFFWSSRRFED